MISRVNIMLCFIYILTSSTFVSKPIINTEFSAITYLWQSSHGKEITTQISNLYYSKSNGTMFYEPTGQMKDATSFWDCKNKKKAGYITPFFSEKPCYELRVYNPVNCSSSLFANLNIQISNYYSNTTIYMGTKSDKSCHGGFDIWRYTIHNNVEKEIQHFYLCKNQLRVFNTHVINRKSSNLIGNYTLSFTNYTTENYKIVPANCVDLLDIPNFNGTKMKHPEQYKMNDKNWINNMNYMNLSFISGKNDYATGSTTDFIKTLGTRFGSGLEIQDNSILDVVNQEDIPSAFDSRTKWPNCPTIGQIRNQGHCGGCWAFGAAEVAEDRYCINYFLPITLSPQNMIDCDHTCLGCGGGWLDNAWEYIITNGVTNENCRPYKYCDFPSYSNCTVPHEYRNKTKFHKISINNNRSYKQAINNTCLFCKDGESMKKTYARSAYAVADVGDHISMQKEIMLNGPIEVVFFVFYGFQEYRSGIYRLTREAAAKGIMGAHAVKIIGWGSLPEPYWIVANSWGPNWGENGFFRIRRGYNECGIETTPAAGYVF